MKRNVLLFLLIFVMACLSLALCGSDMTDGNLTMDEDDFVELVVDAPQTLHYLESVYALKALNQMVGNVGEDGYAEVLYNANDEAEYVLATAEEGGYAIFHRMTGALMEAGEHGTSPYAGQSGRKYYFGPSNYAVGDEQTKTDVMRGGEISAEQLSAMHRYMAEKRTQVIERSETKSYANMLKTLQTDNTAVQQSDISVMNVITGPWKNNPYARDLSIANFTNVADSYIFEYSYGKQTFGYNSHGSCSIVALTLLMKYYDQTVAPGLIPGNKDAIPNFWFDECADAPLIESDYGLYDCEILSSDSVYEAVHKFLIAISETDTLGPSRYCQSLAILNYGILLPNCTDLGMNSYTESDIDELFDKIKQQINSNTPVKLSIVYREQVGTEDMHHAIVVYGYYDNGNGDKYYRTHFGWESSSSIIVPHIFANADYDTLSVTNHQQYHNENSCTYGDCFSNNKHTISPTQYGHICSCGETVSHAGTDATSIWTNYSTDDGTYNAQVRRTMLLNSSVSEISHFYACNVCLEYVLGYALTNNTEWIDDYSNLLIISNRYTEIMRAPHVQGDIYASGGKCVTSCIYCAHERDAEHTRGGVFASEGKCMTQCSCCGTVFEIPHIGNFTYFAKINYHITTCNNCSASYQEAHTYLYGIEGCAVCGFGAGLIGGIIKGV